jgi:hypothetical protein
MSRKAAYQKLDEVKPESVGVQSTKRVHRHQPAPQTPALHLASLVTRYRGQDSVDDSVRQAAADLLAQDIADVRSITRLRELYAHLLHPEGAYDFIRQREQHQVTSCCCFSKLVSRRVDLMDDQRLMKLIQAFQLKALRLFAAQHLDARTGIYVSARPDRDLVVAKNASGTLMANSASLLFVSPNDSLQALQSLFDYEVDADCQELYQLHVNELANCSAPSSVR